MQRGSLTSQVKTIVVFGSNYFFCFKKKFSDRTNPMDKHLETMTEKYEFSTAPGAAQLFGNAGRDYMKKYSKSFKEKVKNQITYLIFLTRCFT
jgi:hypothetical protein